VPGRHWWSRAAVALGIALSGLFVGIAVGVQHRLYAPWGLVLGVVIYAIYALALRLIHPGRLALALGMGGAFVSVTALSTELGRGYVVLSDPLGWGLLAATVVVFLIALGWPDLRGVPATMEKPEHEKPE
jgi:hypothetical protein